MLSQTKNFMIYFGQQHTTISTLHELLNIFNCSRMILHLAQLIEVTHGCMVKSELLRSCLFLPLQGVETKLHMQYDFHNSSNLCIIRQIFAQQLRM